MFHEIFTHAKKLVLHYSLYVIYPMTTVMKIYLDDNDPGVGLCFLFLF